MVASANTPADVVNIALARIGSKHSIGDLYDGSPAANVALNLFGQTRDAVLRSNDWDFAQKIALAVLSGGTAPQPYSFEYAYPADCIRIRDIFNSTYLADKNNPFPTRYKIGETSGANKVVWTNFANATFIYTQQVTNPLLWDPLFVELLSIELGKRMAPSIGSPEHIKVLAEEERIAVPLSEGTFG